MKAFWYNVDASLYKPWSPGSRWATIEKTILLCVYIEKKIFFSRTSKPISIKLGTNHPYVKGIQNCTNQGPRPFQRGDNHKNAKIWQGH
jgi:hypothetical protein